MIDWNTFDIGVHKDSVLFHVLRWQQRDIDKNVHIYNLLYKAVPNYI